MLDEITRAQEQRKNGRKPRRVLRFHAKPKKNPATSSLTSHWYCCWCAMAHSLKMCIGQMKIAHNKYGCLAMAHDNNQIVTEKSLLVSYLGFCISRGALAPTFMMLLGHEVVVVVVVVASRGKCDHDDFSHRIEYFMHRRCVHCCYEGSTLFRLFLLLFDSIEKMAIRMNCLTTCAPCHTANTYYQALCIKAPSNHMHEDNNGMQWHFFSLRFLFICFLRIQIGKTIFKLFKMLFIALAKIYGPFFVFHSHSLWYVPRTLSIKKTIRKKSLNLYVNQNGIDSPWYMKCKRKENERKKNVKEKPPYSQAQHIRRWVVRICTILTVTFAFITLFIQLLDLSNEFCIVLP